MVVCSPKSKQTPRWGYWPWFVPLSSILLTCHNLAVFQTMEDLFRDQCVDADPDDGVVVSEIACPLSDLNLAVLQGLINPRTSTLSQRELYIQTLDLVQRL